MILTIGSEGLGSWGKDIINFLINKLDNNIVIRYENNNSCDLIISSMFVNYEKEWNTNMKKYIYWSGEYYHPYESKYQTKKLYILTTIQNSMDYLYVPYFLYSSHLYKDRISPNINRKYLLAYCSSRAINHREELFNIFVENTSDNSCHALGSCYGKYPHTKFKDVDGGWCGTELIHTYTDYKFVIAVENAKVEGYITEKIINAFYSGAIPIYWGCDTITNYFNKNAFINVNDFNSFEECVKYVINMDEETIQRMTNEPIYNPNNDIVNLLNVEYNLINGNKTLDSYLLKIKNFIND